MDDKQQIQKILSERLKKARIERGLTQPELAKIINSTDRNISNYETGYSFPSLLVLYKISIALSTSVDYLFGFTDNPTIEEANKDMSADDYRILHKLKNETELYEFLLNNGERSFYYINKIRKLFDEWKEEDSKNN